jgi:membrane-bound lytic murein transglycosylase D
MPVTTVPIKGAVELASLAGRMGVPERLIRHWNPEIVNAITPPVSQASGPYPLRLSPILADKWAMVETKLEFVDVKDVLYHRIRPGETLGAIASRYRVDKRSIISLNPGLHPTRLRIGKEVAVPVTTIMPRGASSKKQAGRGAPTQG